MTSVIVVDSITEVKAASEDAVAATGSHGGRNVGWYAAATSLRGVLFNDAGVGKGFAGIAGLEVADAAGLAAATVGHESARIGSGRDTVAAGVVSYVNCVAAASGVRVGMAARVALDRLRLAPGRAPDRAQPTRALEPIIVADGPPPIVLVDSIAQAGTSYAGAVVVSGSHGGVVSGHAVLANLSAAFFNDAGVGKDRAGISRLLLLDAQGIAGATADYRSARIGEGQDSFEHGVLSHVNRTARAAGIAVGQSVEEAARSLAARHPGHHK